MQSTDEVAASVSDAELEEFNRLVRDPALWRRLAEAQRAFRDDIKPGDPPVTFGDLRDIKRRTGLIGIPARRAIVALKLKQQGQTVAPAHTGHGMAARPRERRRSSARCGSRGSPDRPSPADPDDADPPDVARSGGRVSVPGGRR
jgi:hypothetical protein